MEAHRRIVSVVAILIATVYYLFGRAEAATPERTTVTGHACKEATEKMKMIQCKPAAPNR
jgi:hypothetical protein